MRFDSYNIKEYYCDNKKLSDYEKYFIWNYQPKYNINYHFKNKGKMTWKK